MNAKVIWCIVVWLLLSVSPTILQAQSVENLWKEVENAQHKGLPQTAIKYAEQIFRKAEAEKKIGQMLKAYTARSQYRQSIAPDSFFVDLKKMETWAGSCEIPADCAVLNTLIAKIYSDYAQSNMYNILRRSEVADTPPDDIREWSGGMFVRKILDHTREALKDPVMLFSQSSKPYIPFVEQQSSSRYFDHNMYHLLATYGVGSLKGVRRLVVESDSTIVYAIDSIYSGLKTMYRQHKKTDALVLLTLEEWSWQKSEYRISTDTYLSQLDQLIETHGDRPVCAEAYLNKAQVLMSQSENVKALHVCREAIARYPKYDRLNALKQLQNTILTPYLVVSMPAMAYPGDSIALQVSHTNLKGFTVHIYKVNQAGSSSLARNMSNEKALKAQSVKVYSHQFSLTPPEDYLVATKTCSFVTPEEGLFLVEIVPDQGGKSISWQILSVTRIKLLSRMLSDNRFEVAVLDSKSGAPIADATVNMYVNDKGDARKSRSVKSNSEGRAELEWDNVYRYISAGKGNDTAYFQQWIRKGSYSFSDIRDGSARLTLLTDRSLYRPGQTVYVKGVAYHQLSDTANVAAGKEFTLALYDANNREIDKKSLKTNEFGSFTAEFILPSGALNGMYSLRTTDSQAYIRVEEYKRPTFEVILGKAEGAYKVNDDIQLKGSAKTLSGVPVQDAQVNYIVTRSMFSWWRQMLNINTTIDSGVVELDENGEFIMPVSLKSDKNDNPDHGYYAFQITATVTNVAGETQMATTRIMAGNRSVLLSVDAPNQIRKDTDINLVFQAVNLNEQPVDIKGEYQLYSFSDYTSRKLSPEPALTGVFTSNISTSLPEWKTLPSGVYKLTLSARDVQGLEATYETETVLFSLDDTRPVEKAGIWYYGVNTEFDASHPADFIFGTSDKDAYILMDVFSANKRLESRSILLTDSVMRFTYPYKEEYGDGLNVTFCYVKEGQAYTNQVSLTKKMPDKALKLSWSSFRDKLRPGQQEEWRLTIRNPDGSLADAELLATMYDASLDQIWKRDQLLSVHYKRNIPSAFWYIYHTNNASYSFSFPRQQLAYPNLIFDSFWMYDYQTFPESRALNGVVYGSSKQTMRLSSISTAESVDQGESFEMNVVAEAAVRDYATDDAGSDGQQLPDPPAQLRTNFVETAFFYPQLRTNEEGEIVIAFTLPESLTRWNFKGYAHTKGMLTGMINSEAVASKEFMLTPNLPRFVRVGDKTSVAALVTNLTDKQVSGQVVLTLFDPLTNKVVATQKQNFSSETGKTTGVSFMFEATDKYDLLGCRLVAEGGAFSDGEQHVLPVLSNKERVIETVAMPIRGSQTREFALEHLFNGHSKTATDRRLTVEFSGNPSWYAIQALPSLSLPVNENAISWATAYYANALASYIVNNQPRLKAVFEAWKLQGGTKDTFLSNLQKNQDVKNILLEESPWIMEATTEQEQKERIATLFDLNNIRNNNLTALNKLKELQLNSGAWTWYKGMTGSRHITNYVTLLLTRLTALSGQTLDREMIAMRNAAFVYLHEEASKEYKEILQNEKRGHVVKGISGNALQYLYLIAVSGENVPANSLTAYTYFLNKIKEDIATQDPTQKALAAIVLQKAGRAADAQAFLTSLKEYLTQTDEQGMFFAFNEGPLWTGLKIPAHVYVMEAFDMIGNDREIVEEMKLWLLKQKQTQQWNSPVSTANAVYALLYRGTDLSESRGEARVTLRGKGTKTWDTSASSVPGLAYIKETVTDTDILSKTREVVVEKRDEGIAWGAVYAQYEEDMDKISSQGEGLNVEKKLYVEQVVGDRKELFAVSSDNPLKVGDKVVVRVTIKLDRAMDFVQLKDQRAACLEPVSNLSGYLWGAGTGYYVAVKDASTNFYFDSLNKGVYVLEHSYRVSRAGTYESGISILQSAYAPEFAAHSTSVKLICQ